MHISIHDFLSLDFDYIIDARSPKEYEESHIPGSINLYVLNNEEHHIIGNMYKNISKSKAKKEGVIYILKNISMHLEKIDFKPGSKIAIYCARGGNRSTALYTILSQLDYKVYKLEGGYKAYRKWVVNYLENFPHDKFVTLRGNTGCGKTEILNFLSPSLNLEELANHYGSNFGNRGKQPSQKMFENTIASFLNKTDPNEPIYIEAESSKIGKLFLPKHLLTKMREGLQIEITAPMKERIKRILKYYGNIDKKEFNENLEKIKKHISGKVYEEIKNAYESGNLEKVAEILLTQYYDKVYKKREAAVTFVNTNPQATAQKIKTFTQNYFKLSKL
jgi:tRNA 2-selenouridine synthase